MQHNIEDFLDKLKYFFEDLYELLEDLFCG